MWLIHMELDQLAQEDYPVNHQIFLDTEEHIAKWLNKPAAVMFNSWISNELFDIFSTLFKILLDCNG